MSTMPKFIKEKDGGYAFNSDGTFVFYVPEKFFDTKLAIFNGEYISLFGICTYAILNKDGKPTTGLHNFNFPAMFVTKPDDIEIVKGLKLTKNTDVQDYRLLKYNKDAMIVVSSEVVVDGGNLDTWYRALQYGNIPNTIPYDRLQEYFLRNIELTENSYDVSLQLIGIVVSECARSAADSSVPFRLSGSKDMNEYRMVNIRDIPREVSPFTAFTSETWDKALVSSIVVDNNGESPLEKIMMD